MLIVQALELEQLLPGVYSDARGRLHLDMPTLVRSHGHEPTAEACRHYARKAMREIWREVGSLVQIAHLNGLSRH